MTFLMSDMAFGNNDNYLLNHIFENHGSIMMIMDPETGDIIDVNGAAIQFYGYEINEIRQMSIDQINLLSPEEVKKERVLAVQEKRNYFVFKHRLKNGEIKDVEVYSYPIETAEGKQLLFSIIHDITPRIEAERLAKVSELTIIGLLILGSCSLLLLFISTNRSKKLINEKNNQLKRLFDNMQEGFGLHEIICDEAGNPVDYKFIDVNKAFERITGFTLKELKNKTVNEVLPGSEKFWIKKYGKVALTGEPTTFTNYARRVGKHFSVSVYSPAPKQFATVFTDISEQKNMEMALEKEKALFKTTLHSLGDGVISTDIQGCIEIMNKTAEQMTGWKEEEARGLHFDEVFILMDAFTREPIQSPIEKVFELEETLNLDRETLLVDREGNEYPIEDSFAPIKEETGKVIGAVIIFRDYSEKKEKQEEILYLSYHDQLTGLYNRRFFEEELKRLDTPRNLPLTIAMVDVNGLKLTNDAFGHMAGDGVLKRVSEVLKEECRSDDIVARIGGDEFIILLPKTSYKETQKIIERIYRAFDGERQSEIVLSVSIGWETKSKEEELCTDIFIKAEEDMYRKKMTESQSMRSRTLQGILKTVSEKNAVEKVHSRRVSLIAQKIGEAMELNYDRIQEIAIVGIMHDIGKISIDNTILNKSEPLVAEEIEEIRKHPMNSYQILKSVDGFSALAEIALYHHERWDGSGYPNGLRGNAIPLISRIIAVADAFEAMTTYRPYREPMSQADAVAELRRCSGTQFDPDIIEACGEMLEFMAE